MRVFIGLPLCEQARCACRRLVEPMAKDISGRWTLEENWHITLAFVGEIEASHLAQVRQIGSRTAARVTAPELTLEKPGIFGKEHSAILYCGVTSSYPLEKVHDELIDAFAKAGLPFDPGPFRAHITLARKADVRGGIHARALNAVSWKAGQMTIFQSARDEKGVLRYTPLASCDWKAE